MLLKRIYMGVLLGLAGALMFQDRAEAVCTALGCNCSVSVNTMSFGTYDPQDLSPHDGVGNVNVTCTALLLGGNVSYEISINEGSSGSYSSRTLQGGQDDIDYNLYTNSARTLVWGDGSGGTVTQTDGYSFLLGLLISRDYTIYGRIPASQAVPADNYSDTLTVTIVF